MKIINGLVFTEEGELAKKNLAFNNGLIVSADESISNAEEVYNASGCYVLPGLIDIHIHGAVGVDFCDGKKGDLEKISQYLVKNGITGFLGTSMSFNEETLEPLFIKASDFKAKQEKEKLLGATLLGINMEGPFINPEKSGAQNVKNIQLPDYEMFERLWNASNETIRLVALAPEMEGSKTFIEKASKKCAVSLGHTAANYEIAKQAFEDGAKHVTHLFNAMPPFAHREPGVIGAAIEDAEHIELICDGYHVHPTMIRSIFHLFSNNQVCLVSDSMRAAGMKDGEYSLGGQKVIVKNKQAVLENGTIAGSTTNLQESLKKAILFGIPIKQAISAVTSNPAKAISVFHERGSLSVGKIADISIFDEQFNVVAVFKNGMKVLDTKKK